MLKTCFEPWEKGPFWPPVKSTRWDPQRMDTDSATEARWNDVSVGTYWNWRADGAEANILPTFDECASERKSEA